MAVLKKRHVRHRRHLQRRFGVLRFHILVAQPERPVILPLTLIGLGIHKRGSLIRGGSRLGVVSQRQADVAAIRKAHDNVVRRTGKLGRASHARTTRMLRARRPRLCFFCARSRSKSACISTA